jgi:hypothetical protein
MGRYGGYGVFFFGKKNSLRSDTFFLSEKYPIPPYRRAEQI